MNENKVDRSGVALIIVLGLVAILLLVSVAFTINMRVERASAANLRHAAVARQIVKGAMAATLAAIDMEVGTNMTPQWYETDSPTDLIYERDYFDKQNRKLGTQTLWKDTYVSYDPSNTEHIAANFFTPAVESYFPSGSSFRGYATKYVPAGSTDGGKSVDLPEWIPIFSDKDNKDVIGRYAFFVLDTSGLLNLNGLHQADRWMGWHRAEMQLSDALFPQELNPQRENSANYLKKLRTKLIADGRYDSFAEFRALTEDISQPFFKDTRSFNTFSLDFTPTNIAYVGGGVADLTDELVTYWKLEENPGTQGKRVKNKWAIIDALYESGLTASSEGFSIPAGRPYPQVLKVSEQACWAYLGLVDFVDGDDEMFFDPEIGIMPWERPVTENLPFMSGFIAKFTATAHELVVEDGFINDDEKQGKAFKVVSDVCAMTLAVDFKIPFVYPFLKTRPDSYDKMRIEGRAALLVAKLPTAANSQNKPFRKLVDKLNEAEGRRALPQASGPKDPLCDFSFPDDIALHMPTNQFFASASDIVKVGGAPPSLKGMRLYFKAAGETRLTSRADGMDEPEHRYPLKPADYANFNAWMASSFEDFDKQGHDFGPDNCNADNTFPDPESKHADKLARDKNGNIIKFKTWNPTPVVTWAEFTDPRFASREMAEIDVDNDGGEPDSGQFLYYRPAHLDATFPRQQHFDVPVTELKSHAKTSAGFGGFTAANGVDALVYDGPATDPDIHGGYFNGAAARNGQTSPCMGASPVASHLLTHPAAAGDVYGMRMDGVRYRRDSSKNFDSDTQTDTAQRQWRMYVKNAPLESVGELAYLPIGMWNTIRLYDYGDGEYDGKGNYKDAGRIKFNQQSKLQYKMTRFNHLPCDDNSAAPPYHRVLDFLTVRPHSRVNLNSLNPSIIATAFHYMPIGTEAGSHLYIKPNERASYEKYRIDSESGSETDSLDLLAEAVMRHRESGASFNRLSDLGRILRYGDNEPPNGHPLNGKNVGLATEAVATAAKVDYSSSGNVNQRKKYGEFERESVVRNSCGLFTRRGQTFIIAVRGESYSPMFGKTSVKGGSVNAAKTAVAQVWRDTIPGNYDEVEAYLAELSWSNDRKDAYRREHYWYPKLVQFFKIIDD